MRTKTRYQQLVEVITEAIDQGRIAPGSILPSIRECARQHGLAINTVITAYQLLEDRGLVRSVPQSGFHVCPRLPEVEHPLHAGIVSYSSSTEKDLLTELLEAQSKPGVVDLAFAAPRGQKFYPGRTLAQLTKQVLHERASVVTTYALPPGSGSLCEQIAGRAKLLGMALSPEDLVLTHGATEALQLALRAVAKPGDTVAIEAPTYFNLYPLLQSMGLIGLEVPTHPRTGLMIQELESLLAQKKIAAVVTMPTVQNPLGCSMPADSKRRLAALAERYETPIIEDAVYAELQYEEPLKPTVRSFDSAGWVMVCGGFSKTLAPDYRLGWLDGGRFSHQVKRLKFASSATESVLLSEAIARYIQNGGYDRHLRSLRRIYQSQVDAVRGLIGKHFPAGTRATQPDGGFVIWVELPEQIHTTELFRKALLKNVVFMPGELYSDGPRFTNCMRIACCQDLSEVFIRALKILGDLAWQELNGERDLASLPTKD
ncbi:PLP-dependent aminotransferase family protein [Pseudomonas monteilii]|uniref:PLP-dependent aminotransferase family protein n=2 Tax=Pseudomonas monteilii TaxID=76759 RepID=A0A399M481_9PSED|nr:PLP-dependent aminotransferase family protein [Pseudomonas monteilii]